MAACDAGQVDMIITKSVSRFGRNTVDTLTITRNLKEKGIDVFFEEQNIHSISEDGELMLTLVASIAQAESLSCSENVRWRIKSQFSNGYTTAIHMLGYCLKDKEIEMVPEEA